MADAAPDLRAGQEAFGAYVRASYTVDNQTASQLSGGEALKPGAANGELQVANASGDNAVAVFADGQTLAAGTKGVRAVYFFGPVLKVKAGGAVSRGDHLRPTTAGKWISVADAGASYSQAEVNALADVRAVALDAAAADGDFIRICIK